MLLNAKSRVGGPAPEPRASWLSLVFFSWLSPLVAHAYRTPLMESDLYDLPDDDLSAHVALRFEQHWRAEVERARAAGVRPALWRVLKASLGRKFALAAGYKWLQDTVQFVGPVLLTRIISFVQSTDQPLWLGFAYVAVFLVAKAMQTLAINHYFAQVIRVGMRLRAVLTDALFRKSLKLSPTARTEMAAGEVTNMMSNDVSRMAGFCQVAHLLWSAPYQIAICLVLLFQNIGPAAFAGVAVMACLVPLQGACARILSRLRSQIVDLTDARIKSISEMLQGSRIIKYYGWQDQFRALIERLRKSEVLVLRKQMNWEAFNVFLMVRVVSVLLFASNLAARERAKAKAERVPVRVRASTVCSRTPPWACSTC